VARLAPETHRADYSPVRLAPRKWEAARTANAIPDKRSSGGNQVRPSHLVEQGYGYVALAMERPHAGQHQQLVISLAMTVLPGVAPAKITKLGAGTLVRDGSSSPEVGGFR